LTSVDVATRTKRKAQYGIAPQKRPFTRVIADIYALANAEVLPNSTTRAFFKAWLDRKSLEADEATHQRYTGVITQFLGHIGRKADSDIKKITPTDVAGFRDDAAKRLAVVRPI
jgi:hypothetical protein